ncbi:nitrogen regulation protein NR(II) [Azovibrio restrictus]|uniref:nitrogen regulation protein NR(II) n=1 Tax=Azovibrio restrictus TaxID=146938 RepID=UPI0026EB1482|nr:nitrogen regulation protein NR(II) [Azovibrio restrictus]MDD3484191.1 nitrogen regulation protein NR(II) [Azovibrio restrictus]
MTKTYTPFSGLDHLASAVVLMDAERQVRYANSAAENLLAVTGRSLIGRPLDQVMRYSATLQSALDNAIANNWSYTGQNVEIRRGNDEVLHLNCTVTPVHCEDAPEIRMLMELQPIDQQLKASREERLIEQQQASRELIRNLAHEIKNPLGGIRGAAQLLEHELNNPSLQEYTQVIIKEADRLQDLMQRLLSPHRASMQPYPVSIHEVLERVRSLLLLEYPDGLSIRRDYDTSLPDLVGDREQLIQVFLNIARNAAQAMEGKGEIIFQTRSARQVTLVKRRFRLAIDIAIIDNGPGIPDDFKERMFYPLVSGRPEGTGLGLTLAQSFVQQHQGTIECDSRPGRTCFLIRLPMERA